MFHSMASPPVFRHLVRLGPQGLLLLMCLRPMHIQAHGDTHGMILAITQELKERPRDPDLYYRRGELYRRHAEWDLAWADYESAAKNAMRDSVLDLSRGLLLAEARWPRSAKGYLDRFLSSSSNNVAALSTRARVHLQLNDLESAMRDYDTALQHATDPRPELYLERCSVLLTNEPPRLAQALEGLEAGIKKLGPVVTLQLQAIDVELRLSHTNQAIARLDGIIASSPRKETWYARRGEILAQAGRWEEARETFLKALEQLKSLPASRRNVPAMQELERRIQQAITETSTRAGK